MVTFDDQLTSLQEKFKKNFSDFTFEENEDRCANLSQTLLLNNSKVKPKEVDFILRRNK